MRKKMKKRKLKAIELFAGAGWMLVVVVGVKYIRETIW